MINRKLTPSLVFAGLSPRGRWSLRYRPRCSARQPPSLSAETANQLSARRHGNHDTPPMLGCHANLCTVTPRLTAALSAALPRCSLRRRLASLVAMVTSVRRRRRLLVAMTTTARSPASVEIVKPQVRFDLRFSQC